MKHDNEEQDVLVPKTENEVAKMFMAFERVIPEEVGQKFESIGILEDHLQWDKGDLTLLIWDIVQANNLKDSKGNPYTFLDVCYFVSSRYLNFSRSYSTVKAWAITARRFTKKTREAYHADELPFSHFAYAGQRRWDEINPDTGQKYWVDILLFSYSQYMKFGRNCSVRVLSDKYEKEKTQTSLAKATKKQHAPTAYEFTDVNLLVSGPLSDGKAQPQTVQPMKDEALSKELQDLDQRFRSLAQAIAVKFPNLGAAAWSVASTIHEIARAIGEMLVSSVDEQNP
jgi:hypothetical protein